MPQLLPSSHQALAYAQTHCATLPSVDCTRPGKSQDSTDSLASALDWLPIRHVHLIKGLTNELKRRYLCGNVAATTAWNKHLETIDILELHNFQWHFCVEGHLHLLRRLEILSVAEREGTVLTLEDLERCWRCLLSASWNSDFHTTDYDRESETHPQQELVFVIVRIGL